MYGNYEKKENFKELLGKIGLLDFFGSIYGIRWYIRHLKCNVEAKKRACGYIDKRFEKLKQFEGIHKGERCFIVCTGPSLILEDVEMLKSEYTFGLNSITKIFSKTDWRPTYYVIEDMNVYLNLEKDLILANMVNCFASDLLIQQLKPRIDFIAYPFDRLNHSTIRYRPSMAPQLDFSGNAYVVVYGAFTVTFSALQLAVYMGFKEIYLIGCDCDYSGEKKHFEDYEITRTRPVVGEEQRVILTYELAKKYADAHGIKIYNATRGGKLEVFERVNFEEVVKRMKLEEK